MFQGQSDLEYQGQGTRPRSLSVFLWFNFEGKIQNDPKNYRVHKVLHRRCRRRQNQKQYYVSPPPGWGDNLSVTCR